MSNEDLRTEIEDSIKRGLQRFIGEPNTEGTRECIREYVKRLLHSFQYHLRANTPLPDVVVDIHLNQATIYLINPNTKEKMDIKTWATKVSEGSYE